MKRFLEWLKKQCFPRSEQRGEVRWVTWGEADQIMREHPGKWKIARGEDNNRLLGWVYIEKVEP